MLSMWKTVGMYECQVSNFIRIFFFFFFPLHLLLFSFVHCLQCFSFIHILSYTQKNIPRHTHQPFVALCFYLLFVEAIETIKIFCGALVFFFRSVFFSAKTEATKKTRRKQIIIVFFGVICCS